MLMTPLCVLQVTLFNIRSNKTEPTRIDLVVICPCDTYIKFDFQANASFKRRMWNYKRANFNLLNNMIQSTDWTFLHNDSVESATDAFINKFLDLAKSCIPTI